MGFHRRHINNLQIISLFNEGGADTVIKWYTNKVDSLILESGLATDIHKILTDSEWSILGHAKVAEEISKRIHLELGITEIEK